jgi:hypothetical protein
VGWEGDVALITLIDGVIRMTLPPQWLLRAPSETRVLRVAADRVRWSGRQPGPLETGPAFDRYRPIINVAGGSALALILVAIFWWCRRSLREDGHAAIRVV